MKGEVVGDLALVMADGDDVATAIADLAAGTTIPLDDREVAVSEPIPFGHKFALAPIEDGQEIRKYGETIGRATASIAPGDWVHTHNCESTRGRGDIEDAGGDADDGGVGV